MRYLFAAVMFTFSGFHVRALIKGERRRRKQKAEYEEKAAIADLPIDLFVRWVKEHRGV